MPSKWSSEHSKSDAMQLANRLKINLDTISIEKLMSCFEESFINNLNLKAEG